jgi:hypothetical protein
MAAQSNAQQTFEEIVAAVKQAESRGKRYKDDGKTLTTSPKGALGEMQVMPKTITDPGFGVIPAKSSSPDEIARVGRDYLQAMLSKYGDTEKALVAYNWGPGATDKWLASGAKPEALPQETRTYVQRVKGLLGKDVSRETMAKKEREPLPASLPPMAEASPTKAPAATVMASGKSLPDIKSMPASYQAAFALAALADAKDDEDEKAYDENKETESEKLMREYKPVNHLASLDLSVTPITMAEGGEVDSDKSPDDINYFSNVNRMKDRGVTTDSVMLGARTKAGEGSVIAGLNMANMSKDEKMQTARALMLAYTQQDPEGLGFTANVVKPQGAPAMANLIGSMPLGEGRVSAGMHGNQAYSLGYERPVEGGQFNANLNVPRGTMGSPQLNLQFNKRFADGGEVEQERLTPQQIERIAAQGPTERKDEPFFDAASRTYVDVLTGRRTPITEKDFTAKEQMAMMDAVRRSQARGGKGRVGYEDYPTGEQIGPDYVDIRNTLGGFQYKQNPDGSTVISDRYDFHGPRVAEYEKMGTGEKVLKSAKNALTEFVTKGFSPRDLAGELGRAYVGSKGPDVNIRIPVNRADGSPEEGERLTPQQIERIAARESADREAASNAAFIAQKSGIGRKEGNISKALNTGTAYPAIVAGINDVPYDLAGLPVDLTTMAMRPFGYSNQKPMLGSEYLKEKATEAGIRKPTPTDPTLKGFHTFGELGAGLLAPGKIIEGAQALKVAAADALAGFKAGRAEKPSVTDLMTGQRFETPELTPQQLQEFENWRSMSQAQLRAQNLAQRDEAVTRLPQDAQQQLRLFEENAIPRPVEQPLNNPPGWNIVDTGTEVAPALEAAAPVAAEARTMAQLPVVTPVAAPAPMQISAEFPFVGRLDEFAASMQGPAQKEQLINQVKGKFREQDVARLEEALAGLGPKDKVTPAMLQEALANTYSPSRLRSIDELASQGKPMYSNMDNVFAPDKPISGSMNLYIKQTPEAEALAKDAAELKLALNNVFQGRGDSSMFDTIDNILTNSPITGQLKNIGELKQQLSAYRPLYEKFNKIQQEANDAKHMLTYPVISGEKVFGKPLNDVVNERVKTAIQEGISAGRIPPIPHVDVPNQQLTPQQRMEKFVVENSMYAVTKQLRLEEEAKLFTEIMQKGSDKLVQLGVDPIDVTAIINKLPVKPSEDIYAANRGLNSDIQFNEQVSSKIQAVRDSVKAAQGKVQDKMRDRYDRAIEDVNPLIGYRGQHAGVAGEVHPVGFARYTEHTVDMNGKQLNGRHVHELQSDLAQDVRQLGSKSGSLEKDQAELATLKSKLAEVDELDPTQQIEKAKLNKRISTVEKRISLTSPGKYQLEQPFAGFETSPAVEMQLLIKNAIQSTMRSGQDFVTFPGKESSQAKLYEKVLPNLKQAVKDLGGEKAGFDIKPITLPNPSGDSPTVWGVVWSPETAAKIMQKGVPFNKGGMVERQPTDNRRYL